MKVIGYIALILVIIGALNWGLWGFFQFDFVAWVFDGNTMWSSRIVYAIIGLAGLWALRWLCCRSCCGKGSCSCDCKCCSGKGGTKHRK